MAIQIFFLRFTNFSCFRLYDCSSVLSGPVCVWSVEGSCRCSGHTEDSGLTTGREKLEMIFFLVFLLIQTFSPGILSPMTTGSTTVGHRGPPTLLLVLPHSSFEPTALFPLSVFPFFISFVSGSTMERIVATVKLLCTLLLLESSNRRDSRVLKVLSSSLLSLYNLPLPFLRLYREPVYE